MFRLKKTFACILHVCTSDKYDMLVNGATGGLGMTLVVQNEFGFF